ncbi:hypothetical protein IKQ19_10200 [Candidatus Saccharibacteria bacterium]|nr:hypothetical protein [Candidatus Saccharibacteria bacterium]
MTNKKEPLIVSSDIVLNDTHYDNIELIEDGCLKFIVGPETKEITIETLTNNKKNPVIFEYDILITSYDGKNAPDCSGLPGSDATNAGEVFITVKNLVHDVKVYIRGANGGNGGSGCIISEKEGGIGGNGGNGGNGAKVTFKYGHKSTGIPKLFDNKIGCGGNGGDGGICSAPIGKGGTPSTEPTIGGTNGNGGRAGKNGEKGTFTASVIGKENDSCLRILDLNNNEDYNLFLEHRGGEETLKKFPNIWNLIQKKRCKKDLNKASKTKLSFDDLGSNVVLRAVEGSNNNKTLRSNSDLYEFNIQNTIFASNCKAKDHKKTKNAVEQPYACDRDMIIKEKGSNKAIGTVPLKLFSKHVYYISEDVTSDSIKAIEVLNKNIIVEILYTFYYENIEPQIVVCQIPCITGNEGFLYKNFKITDPNYKANGKNSGDIKVLYGRTPENPEYVDADYYGDSDDGKYYSNRKENGGKIEIPTTIIPIKGTIYFKTNSLFKLDEIEFMQYDELIQGAAQMCPPKLTYTHDSENFIVNIGGDDENLLKAVTKKDHFEYHIDKSDDSNSYVIFDLYIEKSSNYGKYDWNAVVTDASFYGSGFHTNECYLVCDIPFRMKYHRHDDKSIPPKQFKKEIYISIRGNDNPGQGIFFESKEDARNAYIPKIMICWGCYAADTLITTTEGTKKASEIKRGDKLPTYSGKILTVSQIYVGEDKWICKIKTIDNKSIRVSGSHAMKLYSENKPDGKKISAGRIKKGDFLMTPNGKVEVTSAEIEAYNDKVYNFEFAEEKVPNYIEANGFWSGDFNAQNEPEKRELTQEQKAICAEIKQLAAELSQKTQQ